MKKPVIVVGAGLSGATIARILKDHDVPVVVFERNKIGGHCADYYQDDILIHANGIHIWHNSDHEVQRFVEQFANFSGYTHKAKSMLNGEIYTFPPNLDTMCKIYGRRFTIQEAKNLNLTKLYNCLFTEYVKKQWGQEPPKWVLDRIPIHYNYNDRYFNDIWEGIPYAGYKVMIVDMLDGIEIIKEDFRDDDSEQIVIYTGAIDEYFQYQYGPLSYRSIRFEHKRLEVSDWQGVAQLNYPSKDIPFTKIIEHKHFEWPIDRELPYTYITKEYPQQWEPGLKRHYPMFDRIIYNKYAALAEKKQNVYFLGRLGRYKYLNMNQAVREAIDLSHKILAL